MGMGAHSLWPTQLADFPVAICILDQILNGDHTTALAGSITRGSLRQVKCFQTTLRRLGAAVYLYLG